MSLWEEFNQNELRQQQRRWGEGGDNNTHHPWGVIFDHRITTSTTITLLLLTVLLAIVRIWFVHVLVPECLADPRMIEAMTRVKSTHLLSSASYTFGSNSGGGGGCSSSSGSDSSMDNRSANRGAVAKLVRNKHLRMYDRIWIAISQQWYKLRPSVRRALGHEPSSRYNNILVADGQQQCTSCTDSVFACVDS